MPISRRIALRSLAAIALTGTLPTPAFAALSRGLELEELVRQSDHVLVGTPLQATCRWVTLGGARMIVTDTRVRVEEVIARRVPSDKEVLVRTLGGIVGDLGEYVSGQAELVRGEPCVLFLSAPTDEVAHATGMAQGHYPLRPDDRGVERLTPSPRLPQLAKRNRSAVVLLAQLDLPNARGLIRRMAP